MQNPYIKYNFFWKRWDINTSEKYECYKKFILDLNDVDDEFYKKILNF